MFEVPIIDGSQGTFQPGGYAVTRRTSVIESSSRFEVAITSNLGSMSISLSILYEPFHRLFFAGGAMAGEYPNLYNSVYADGATGEYPNTDLWRRQHSMARSSDGWQILSVCTYKKIFSYYQS